MVIASAASTMIPAQLRAIVLADGFVGSVGWYAMFGVLLAGALVLFWFVRKKQG